MVMQCPVLEQLLKRLEHYVHLIRRMEFTKEELAEDEDIQHLFERRLHLMLQCAIDIASHLVVGLELRAKEGTADLFRALV